MRSWIVLHKEVGETPLVALERFRRAQQLDARTPLAYAGRLDPMASGKLLVLIGDECKRQDAYLGLDKEYEIEILVGVGSDTGDALGLVKPDNRPLVEDAHAIHRALTSEVGTFERAYPHYSSKTVNGVPLFLHALRGTLDEIAVPTHAETIHTAKVLSREHISTEDLRSRVEVYLSNVPRSSDPRKELGKDFRIEDVRASWEEVLTEEREYHIIHARIVCGSGVYMRTLAQRVGEKLGTSALALSIKRTRIGKYWHGLWIRSYA